MINSSVKFVALFFFDNWVVTLPKLRQKHVRISFFFTSGMLLWLFCINNYRTCNVTFPSSRWAGCDYSHFKSILMTFSLPPSELPGLNQYFNLIPISQGRFVRSEGGNCFSVIVLWLKSSYNRLYTTQSQPAAMFTNWISFNLNLCFKTSNYFLTPEEAKRNESDLHHLPNLIIYDSRCTSRRDASLKRSNLPPVHLLAN